VFITLVLFGNIEWLINKGIRIEKY